MTAPTNGPEWVNTTIKVEMSNRLQVGTKISVRSVQYERRPELRFELTDGVVTVVTTLFKLALHTNIKPVIESPHFQHIKKLPLGLLQKDLTSRGEIIKETTPMLAIIDDDGFCLYTDQWLLVGFYYYCAKSSSAINCLDDLRGYIDDKTLMVIKLMCL